VARSRGVFNGGGGGARPGQLPRQAIGTRCSLFSSFRKNILVLLLKFSPLSPVLLYSFIISTLNQTTRTWGPRIRFFLTPLRPTSLSLSSFPALPQSTSALAMADARGGAALPAGVLPPSLAHADLGASRQRGLAAGEVRGRAPPPILELELRRRARPASATRGLCRRSAVAAGTRSGEGPPPSHRRAARGEASCARRAGAAAAGGRTAALQLGTAVGKSRIPGGAGAETRAMALGNVGGGGAPAASPLSLPWRAAGPSSSSDP